MQSEPTVEQQIDADIAKLRAQFRDTRALYREVCALLFFRYGVTPTANRLYQLVRKGSMSTPAAALSKFWNELREKSRLRIEHPDLPQELQASAGDFAGAFWAKAQAAAEESLDAFRNEARAAVAEAEAAKSAAQENAASIGHELEESQTALAERTAHASSVERELAAEKAAGAVLLTQLDEARDRQSGLERALDEARREFTAELEKLRQALQLAEERHRTSEERALREIDHERTAAAKLRKELERSQSVANQTAERHRQEAAARQTELGALRQQLGVLEGSLSETKGTNAQLAIQLDAERGKVANAIAQMSAARAEAISLKEQLDEAKRAATARFATRRTKKQKQRPRGREITAGSPKPRKRHSEIS